MAKRIKIDTPIPSLETPWDDGTQAYTGRQVESFIKGKISEALDGLENKFGGVTFEGGRLVFHDEEGGRQLAAVSLAGQSYVVSIDADRSSAFYVLTSANDAIVNFTPTTKLVELGSTEKQDFPEDYTFSMEVDNGNGNGYIDRTPANNTIREGESGTINIKPYLLTGTNKIRIVVTGLTSEQPKTMVLTATLTSLTLSCAHTWHKAWIQGEDYALNGIFFGGNLAKTLHVRIGDREYTQAFSAATQYTSVSYQFNLKDKFPEQGTGVYDVEVWMEGGEVLTRSFKYRIMCVATADVQNARLICINETPASAVNFSMQELFKFATYNLTEVTLDINAIVGGDNIALVNGQTMSVQTQTATAYPTNLQVDTELLDGLRCDIALYAEGISENASLPLDNSNAYVATPGATFYLNPALRANNRTDKEEIHNIAPNADRTTYPAQWHNFTWKDDGWATDRHEHKALIVMAGSSMAIPDYFPLASSRSGSATLEFMYKVSNVADYDNPIFSVMSTETFNADNTVGVVLFPTRLLVLSNQERATVYQKLDLPEDRIIHVAVVLQRGYSNTGRNLCRIYINGCENATFEYSGTSSFISPTESIIRIGQESTDFYLYMMRTYGSALEGAAIHNNYINALIESVETSKAGEKRDNSIMDGGVINYDLCKRAGFNCMVIETDEALPSLANPSTGNLRVNMRFEYNDHPDWNVIIHNVPLDGQGTTSMKYAKWNLRNKIKSEETKWEYPNRPDGQGNPSTIEFGKEGYIAGYGLHPKVAKITSKKNVASSPQGHKMGATAMYHELFELCEAERFTVGSSPERPPELPDGARVATYQHPFIGFQKFSNGVYQFIGLYTSGPDKTDKKTFGYDDTTHYPSLMMIEGPNHSPYMTRFLVPWTDEVFYDYQNETLSIGDSTQKQEGWDADIAAGYSTDSEADSEAIMALFTSEWKPAYDAIYYTSPYIASLEEAGYTLDQINANVSAFQSGTTNGHKNALLTLYDSQYRLIYFRYKTQRYEVLPLEKHNLREYLGLSGNPTPQQIRDARAEKFKTEVFRYVDKQEALFHNCFCELLGVSDNFAKNTYWRKFNSIAEGGKWGFNEDDLDTIMQNDNNGQDTKEYFVEPDDVNPNDGAEIFQGSSSAFWYQLRQCCQNELRDKMLLIVTNAEELAGRYNCSASTKAESLFNIISYYFWEHSAKYFPAMAYNEDALFAYINVWASAPDASYNNVKPLTQAHGDHLETESAWVERRIAYIFSKYRIGGFKAQDGDGYGTLEFTPANDFDIKVTPAIDLYPRVSFGGAGTEDSTRTKAGEICTMHLAGNSDTGIYIKGMDWLSDLGDLHTLRLASRGGSDEINFSVQGKRLRRVVVGSDEYTETDKKFNATSLSVDGSSIEEIYAQNVTTLKGQVDLLGCSRLKKAFFHGTSLSQILLPIGGRVNEVTYPATLTTLFLHSLSLLQQENMTIPEEAYARIVNLYINRCDALNPVALLTNILSHPNHLANVTMVWDGVLELESSSQLDLLAELADGNMGRLTFENGQLSTEAGAPEVQGRLYIPFPVYEDSLDKLRSSLTTLTMSYDPANLYIRFADNEVFRVLMESYGDGAGITNSQAATITDIGNKLRGNATIESFDEFGRFGVNNASDMFNGCTALRSATLPNGTTTIQPRTFYGCTALETITLPDTITVLNGSAFENCGNISRVNIPSIDTWLKMTVSGSFYFPNHQYDIYAGGNLVEDLTVPLDIDSIPQGRIKNSSIKNLTVEGHSYFFCGVSQFKGNINLETVTVRDSVIHTYDYCFQNCANLRSVVFQNVTLVESLPHCASLGGAFGNCSNLESATFEGGDFAAIQTWASAFQNCTNLRRVKITDTSGVRSISSMFNGCQSLETIEGIEHWDTSNVKSMGSTFAGCASLERLDLNDWDTSSLEGIRAMFSGCTSLAELNIGDWDTSSLTDSSWPLPYGAPLTTLDCHNWDFSNVTAGIDYFLSGQVNLRFLTVGVKWFKTTEIYFRSANPNDTKYLGIVEEIVTTSGRGTSNGWIEHVAETAPTIRNNPGADLLTCEVEDGEEKWYLNDGVTRTIYLPSFIGAATSAQAARAVLIAKGYIIA